MPPSAVVPRFDWKSRRKAAHLLRSATSAALRPPTIFHRERIANHGLDWQIFFSFPVFFIVLLLVVSELLQKPISDNVHSCIQRILSKVSLPVSRLPQAEEVENFGKFYGLPCSQHAPGIDKLAILSIKKSVLKPRAIATVINFQVTKEDVGAIY
nr:hypothetical protein Iba_chr09cCG3200 [Ipomoea batatas]